MRAIRKRDSGPGLVLDEVPVPTPGQDEVLVRIEAASICGTDLHIDKWDQWSSERVRPPLTLGHELCGTVVSTGSAVRDVVEGEYVSAESHVTCGVCFHCRTGKAHMCEQTQILGVDRDGGFADYVAVPASVIWRNDRSKLPPRSRACRSRLATRCSRRRPGPRGARRRRARVRAGRALHDRDREGVRVGPAPGLGSRSVPHRPRTPGRSGRRGERRRGRRRARWFAEHNDGIGVGVVFEMSGALKAIEDAFGIVRHGGNVVLFGIPSRPATIDIAESLIFKNLTVSAVNGREIWETWYTTRWLLEHGVVDLRPLITAELPLERYEEAFALLESGEACKIVLRPNGAGP